MAYSITPTAGINLTSVVNTNPSSDGTLVPVNGPLGSEVFGSDGKIYVLAVAGASITASTAVCDVDPVTFEVAATGGAYASPDVDLVAGDYAWFGKASV